MHMWKTKCLVALKYYFVPSQPNCLQLYWQVLVLWKYIYFESGITFPIQNGEESYCDKQNWHQLKCVLSYLQLVDDVDGWLAGRDIPGGCIN